jgi:transposase
MGDRAARSDTLDQKPPAIHGQPGVTVMHEDDQDDMPDTRQQRPWSLQPRQRPVSGLPALRLDLDSGQGSHPSTRQATRQRGIRRVYPERDDQIVHRTAKGSRGGRPPVFDANLYKQHNVVERCFNRLKQSRDLATRYANRTAYYQASLTIAAIILWLDDSQDSSWAAAAPRWTWTSSAHRNPARR